MASARPRADVCAAPVVVSAPAATSVRPTATYFPIVSRGIHRLHYNSGCSIFDRASHSGAWRNQAQNHTAIRVRHTLPLHTRVRQRNTHTNLVGRDPVLYFWLTGCSDGR